MNSSIPSAAILLLCPAAAAQGAAFQTPGSSAIAPLPRPQPETGQTDRFAAVFNPAFSFIVDGVFDHVDARGDAETEEGLNLEMRTLEFMAQSWVDPNAWAYFIAATEGEELAVEEAAVHYTGLGGNHTLRVGRFFLDFGKQMQTHVHELRTLERPLVLRTFLGDEVKGDGLQWDCWTPVGDTAAVRWSLGGFATLLPEGEEDGPEFAVATRQDAKDLSGSARVTGFMDVGERGVLQLGASARWIPRFDVSDDTGTQEDLSSTVWGLDLTYGWTSDDALTVVTVGGEYLLNSGDTILEFDGGGALVGSSRASQSGFFVFAEYAWDKRHAVGLQFSLLELPLADEPTASETELYYSRWFSEYHRLRLALADHRSDGPEGDSVRVALQYTATLGAHGHGVNW